MYLQALMSGTCQNTEVAMFRQSKSKINVPINQVPILFKRSIEYEEFEPGEIIYFKGYKLPFIFQGIHKMGFHIKHSRTGQSLFLSGNYTVLTEHHPLLNPVN